MRQKSFYRLTTLLLLAAGTLACSDSRMPRSAEEQGDSDSLTEGYSLRVPYAIVSEPTPYSPGAALRAVGDTEPGDADEPAYGLTEDGLNENKIDHLDLFLLSGDQVMEHYSTREGSLTHDAGTKSLTAEIPKNIATAVNGKEVTLYLIANSAQENFLNVETLDDLKALTETGTLSPDPDAEGKVAPQSLFLMDGKITCTPTWGEEKTLYSAPNPVELRRAAAKIRVRIGKIDVKDYQNGTETNYQLVPENSPAIRLVHYTDRTRVIADGDTIKSHDWKNAAYRTMKQRSGFPGHEGSFYAAMPFYAYENDFSRQPEDETYALIRLKLRPVDEQGDHYWVNDKGEVVPDGTPGATEDPGRDYYYRIRLNYLTADTDEQRKEHLQKIERNYLYDVRTDIEALGSIDEGLPVEVKTNIALQPWNTPDLIDGSLSKAHFLSVRDRKPTMPNTDTRDISFISSTPVKIEITRAYYEYFDVRGDYRRREFDKEGNWKEVDAKDNQIATGSSSHAWDGVTVTPDNRTHLSGSTMTIVHPVPDNFVPFYFDFTVKQEGGPLSETVTVVQYPPRLVTGNRSIGLRNGSEKDENGQPIYADFRHHTTFGALGQYKASGDPNPPYEAQRNNVLYRVTTVVPGEGEVIGDPTDKETGKTKGDEISNNIISPEFIIASQYGTSTIVPQKGQKINGYAQTIGFGQGYGPHSGQTGYPNTGYEVKPPYQNNTTGSGYDLPSKGYVNGDVFYYNNLVQDYYDPDWWLVNTQVVRSSSESNTQPYWIGYGSAEERCEEYFEGEYGWPGYYTEYYVDEYGNWQQRKVYKDFKYKGHWRMPTVAEARIINEMQKNEKAAVKWLMYGDKYWIAQDGYYFNLVENRAEREDGTKLFVRPIFDTYGLDDKGEHEIKSE